MYNALIKDLKNGILPPEIIIPWFGFVIKVAEGIEIKKLFDKIEKEDIVGIFVLIALEVEEIIKKGEEKTKKEMVRVVRSLLEENLKNYGLETKKDYWGHNASWYKDTRDWGIPFEKFEELGFDPGSPWNKCSISAKEQVKCGIPGCEKNGIYIDEKYGKICRNHERYVALRRKKGWKNPYKGIEKEFKPNYDKRRPFTGNQAFWMFVKSQISEKEWGQIWRWAKGRKNEISDNLLEEIKEKIVEAISKLPKYSQKYKKTESLAFINLTCQKCGDKFEFDLFEKIENEAKTLNPLLNCKEKIQSKGECTATDVFKKLKREEITRDEATFILNYNPQKIPTLCPNCGGKNHSKRIYRTAYILKKLGKGEITRDNAASILGYHPQRVGKFRKILEKKGIKALGAKLQDPIFKQT